VWTRLFNENASNGYAVMRLTRDDVVVYESSPRAPRAARKLKHGKAH
jgi:hypothetical protein